MNADAYLHRIGYHGPCEPTVEILRQLHKAHMFSVPFENLDVLLGRPIVLSLPSLFEKVIQHRRGGFCYELNALFGWLLEEIGFQVEMLSGRVFDSEAAGPEFDHMLLCLSAEDKRIADVGFGDSFVEPLLLGHEPQIQYGRSYRLVEQDKDWLLHRLAPESHWEPQYTFSLKPRQLEDFKAMCHYHQTSPDSVFTRRSICSLATRNGRITLSGDHLIITSEGRRREHKITGAEGYKTLLRRYFGIELGGEVDADMLLRSNIPYE